MKCIIHRYEIVQICVELSKNKKQFLKFVL